MAEKIPGKRTRNIFDPRATQPFSISRSKLELFTDCPRCFYLDRRLGVGRPDTAPYTLNSAVDALLKAEFDHYRTKQETHPLMKDFGIKAVPFDHDKMKTWQENFQGVQYFHVATNFIVFGAVDDIWVEEDGTLHVVDYKSTCTAKEISLEDEWKQAYKRQMEIYQWLLRRNEFKVSDVGYFVFANAQNNLKSFEGRLEFKMQIIPYEGKDAWVESTVLKAHECLMSDNIPGPNPGCKYCNYRQAAGSVV
ncbi:MAG: PD-(D/E)XK nuclease family protein [Candidatus Margulisiibacteriota bacterium]